MILAIILFILVGCGSDGSNDAGASSIVSCSKSSDESCAQGQYCNFKDNSCGEEGASGVCELMPDLCAQFYEPVCGCDGKTYPNACEAASHGSSIKAIGECS